MQRKWYAGILCGNEAATDLVRGQFLASKGKPQLKTRADAGLGQGIYALPSFRDRIKSKAHGEATHRTLSIAKIWLFAGRYAQNACLLLNFRRLSTAPKWGLENSGLSSKPQNEVLIRIQRLKMRRWNADKRKVLWANRQNVCKLCFENPLYHLSEITLLHEIAQRALFSRLFACFRTVCTEGWKRKL